MNEDFMQYVYARISKALEEDKKYMELQNKCIEAQHNKDTKLESDISDEMECRSEELCYLRGYFDALQLVQGIK